MDIIPFVFDDAAHTGPQVDVIADKLVNSLLLYFTPAKLPRVVVNADECNKVKIDAGIINLASLKDFEDTVTPSTWKHTLQLAERLKKKDLGIAFFNATSQGGGVALMRHALLRFLNVLGVKCSWHVPVVNPSVFRITKNMHNILQGVADKATYLTQEHMDLYDHWTDANYKTFEKELINYKCIVIDDPQMAGLIPLIKACPNPPFIIFRSHIEVRADLVKDPDSATNHVWTWLWAKIKSADLFISHPVAGFVPNDVPDFMVGWMPATTDWKDGLNKHLDEWSMKYYQEQIEVACEMAQFRAPRFCDREYIVQVARFDPSKGLPDCLEAYSLLFKLLGDKQKPQLILCGHSAADDPDGDIIFQQMEKNLRSKEFEHLAEDVMLIRMPPSDQILNAVMQGAKVALQLSHREGFEVKVSEALHHGKPIVAYRAGGIPLQIQHEVNGYLCDVGDTRQVAKYLEKLFTDQTLYTKMSKAAEEVLSDEVSTVGNALCWLWLTLQHDRNVKLQKRWVRNLVDQELLGGKTTSDIRLSRYV